MDPTVADDFEGKGGDGLFVFSDLASTGGKELCELPSRSEEAVEDYSVEAVEGCGEFDSVFLGRVQTPERLSERYPIER